MTSTVMMVYCLCLTVVYGILLVLKSIQYEKSLKKEIKESKYEWLYEKSGAVVKALVDSIINNPRSWEWKRFTFDSSDGFEIWMANGIDHVRIDFNGHSPLSEEIKNFRLTPHEKNLIWKTITENYQKTIEKKNEIKHLGEVEKKILEQLMERKDG